jgi:RNA polymerase sigma-B factor
MTAARTRPDPPPDEAALFEASRSGDAAARAELVERYQWVAAHAAHRFSDRGEPYDDLLQVGMLGLLKAIDRFDEEVGNSFVAYAMPTVLGELRRYFRDHTWSVHVPRRAKELRSAIHGAVEVLTKELSRTPRVDEIAQHLGVSEENVLEGLEASAAYRAASLQRTLDDQPHGEIPELGFQDQGFATTVDRAALRKLLATVPERERRIVYLRFYENMSQAEIASLVGTSQVHVGRLLTKTLGRLKVLLEERG